MTVPEQELLLRASDGLLERNVRVDLPAHVRAWCPVPHYVCDLAVPSARLCVEVDGASHDRRRDARKDAVRDRALAACGWTILRVAREDVEAHLWEILAAVRTTRRNGPVAYINGRRRNPSEGRVMFDEIRGDAVAAGMAPLVDWMDARESMLVTMIDAVAEEAALAAGPTSSTSADWRNKRDVGETLYGSRLHRAYQRGALSTVQLAKIEQDSPSAAHAQTTKANVWPEITDEEIEAHYEARDMDGAALRAQVEILALVGSRPTVDAPEARAAYVEAAEIVGETLLTLSTAAEVLAWLRTLEKLTVPAGSLTLTEWYALIEGYRPVIEAPIRPHGKIDAAAAAHIQTMRDRLSIEKTALKAQGYSQFYTTSGHGPDRIYHVHREVEWAARLRKIAPVVGTRFPALCNGGQGKSKAVEWYATMTGYLHDDREKAAWRWWEDAREEAAKRKVAAGEKKAERKARGPKVKEVIAGERHIATRKGPHVDGPFSGARLKADHGWRGVQYGRWVNDAEGAGADEAGVLASYDLETALGLPPKAASLFGRVGLAFGARGSSKFAAHYEPADKVNEKGEIVHGKVINLTRTRGAGSLAHEWLHALDHWLADPSGRQGGARYLSHVDVKADNVRGGQDTLDAMAAVMRAIKGTAWSEDERAATARLRELNRGFKAGVIPREAFNAEAYPLKAQLREYAQKERSGFRETPTEYLLGARGLGDYWCRPHELLARAFESYLADKLADAGRFNGYLQDPAPYSRGRHPGGDERLQINGAIDRFMERVREVMEAHVEGRAIKAQPVDPLSLIDPEPYIAALKYGMRVVRGYGDGPLDWRPGNQQERNSVIFAHAMSRMRDVGALSGAADAVKAERVLALLLARMEST